MDCNKCKPKIPVNLCIKCGSNDIEVLNCGYSSFNAGHAKCRKCGNKATSHHGPWDSDEWIVRTWNVQNPTKEEKIESLEKQLAEIKEQIEKTKQRKW